MDALRLSRTSYIILGLLTFGDERSGYDLLRIIKKSITHIYWDPSQSQLYGELQRLEQNGLVTMRAVHETQRHKRLYAITSTGMEVIQKWLADPHVEPDVYKSPFLFKIFLSHLLPRDTLRGLCQSRRAQLAYELAVCQEKSKELTSASVQDAKLAKELWFPLQTLHLSIGFYHAEITWLDGVLEQLAAQQATEHP